MIENPCPYCGLKSVDITCSDDNIKRYLCTGPDSHEWTYVTEESQEESLIVLP